MKLEPPAGYRLLVNIVDDITEEDARAYLLRVFGAKKGKNAMLSKGSKRLPTGSQWRTRKVVTQSTGWRAYVPIDDDWLSRRRF
jgi:hypothetical protein